MKNSEHRQEIKRDIPQQIIKAAKRDSRPHQNHTPDGPAEEYINEFQNDSNELPPAPVITPTNGKSSFWDIFRPKNKKPD
ncbi:hypothetical protein B9G69_009110 [Bdellovibrio sp. SKB1291214]|uniref:hypothetical protein n=1 Tax=Bdellovibrio sp. SKB1291214 TaxID=1732569 RepID=UPI000B5154DC|nr:hypothetical protein [Bdellovibrio sp. SKB1291214]UYL10732.1 hypothetical protein B9G69_009110 [Bdellovibrio sp. SKB1291214]